MPDRFLRASDLGADEENSEWKPALIDERTGEPVVPGGSVGHRYAPGDEGRWNLELDGIEPLLSLLRPWRRRRGGGPAALRRAGRPRAAPRCAAACPPCGSAATS